MPLYFVISEEGLEGIFRRAEDAFGYAQALWAIGVRTSVRTSARPVEKEKEG